MPVLSPHRGGSATLGGGYRSSFSASPIEPVFFGGRPRFTSISERYTTRSYADSDGRRIFTRSGSITEDGVTTRFREEARDPGRREAYGREGGREGSAYPELGRRDSATGRFTALNVVDSVAELRNKYSPANYIPACKRNNDINTTRSKSGIDDIGLPPYETVKQLKKKVNDVNCLNFSNGVYNNTTNNDNIIATLEDTNGNRTSVADLRKKFDRTSSTLSAAVKKLNNRTDDESISNNYIVRSRVNNFASYIPTKNYHKEQNENDIKIFENGYNERNDNDNHDDNSYELKLEYDISTCPKLNNTRSAVSPSSISTTSDTSQTTTSKTNANCVKYVSQEREPSYDEQIYEKYSTSLKSLLPSSSTTTTTTASSKKVLGLNGLKNIGNTCFMNSVIQCLSNTKLLLEYLLKDLYINDINTTISSMKGALIKAFGEVIKELWSENMIDRVVNTSTLKCQIQRFAPRFIGYSQQDAQEFLRYLLEGLHEDVNRIIEKPKPILKEIDEKLSDSQKANEAWSRYLRMDNSRIVDYFVGQLKSTLKCTYCGHCSVTFDPFWDLSLPIPQRTGQLRLSQCLDSFTREETLDGDEKPTCSKCKERRKCTKSFTIQKFPQILVIHLKRFSPTERFRGKLNVIVDFPLEGLDMSQYAADGVKSCRYNLYAVSNHSGTTYSGHYTASCRHPYTGTWHEYNDSRVSTISSKTIVSGEAYVLFYEKESQKSHL